MVWSAVSAAAVASACVIGQVAVGVATWGRTASLRRGEIRGPARCARGSRASSRATLLAGFAGMAVLAAGLLLLFAGRLAAGSAAAVAGGFVATAGLVWRVVAVAAEPDAFVIRYAWRPPFVLPTEACLALHPPRTPLGGWRLEGSRASRRLMPSDLLGHEDVLVSLVRRAGLAFDGRSWRRASTPSSAGRAAGAHLTRG